MDMPLALLNRRRRGSVLNPEILFSVPGSRGFFYDFSDYNTQFTDPAGTTPVTGVGQSLGLVLDKSAGLALGPELVTNGDFSGGATGWTVPAGWSIAGGAAVAAATSASLFGGGFTPVAGRTYRVDFDVVSYTSGTLFITVGGNYSGNPTLSLAAMAPGRKTVYVTAGATLSRGVEFYGGTVTATIDNISVREIPGNHATQATAGSRPLTQVRPMGVTPRNLLTFSEAFDNAAWIKLNILAFGSGSTANSAVAPDGTNTADLIVPDTSSNQHGVYFSAAAVAGTRYTHSFYAKAAGYDWFYMTEGNNVSASASFNLATGTVGTVAGTGSPVATITSVGNGWYRCTLSLTPISTVQNVQARAANADGGPTFAGNGTSGVLIWGAQLEVGSTASTYQPTGPALINGEKRNLLTFTEQFDDAVWQKQAGATVTANVISAPSGEFTADRVTNVNGVSSAAVYQSFTPPAVQHTFSVYLRADTTSTVLLGCFAGSGFLTATPTILSGPGSVSGTSIFTVSGLSTTEWTRVGYTFTGTAVLSSLYIYPETASSGTGKSIYIWGAQFEAGPTPTAYQRVITANEWYEPGFTSYRGIRFDGSDDFLQTAAIDFAGAEVLGSELVSNGTFGTGDLTGWTTAHTAPSTVSVVAGVATWSTDGVNAARIRQSFTTVVGRTYTVSCAGAGVSVSIGTTAGGAEIVALATNNSRPAFTFVATSTTTWLNTTTATNGATLDNVSVKEVLIPADRMTVVAGVRKLSDAARAVLVELGAPAAAGSFRIEAPGSSLNNYAMASGGSTIVGTTAAGFSSPISSVISGLGDISGDNVALRHNGTQVASSPSDQGTGNFANDIVFIGRRGGTTLPFNGVLTFLCVINRTLTASELAQLETFANSRTGAY